MTRLFKYLAAYGLWLLDLALASWRIIVIKQPIWYLPWLQTGKPILFEWLADKSSC